MQSATGLFLAAIGCAVPYLDYEKENSVPDCGAPENQPTLNQSVWCCSWSPVQQNTEYEVQSAAWLFPARLCRAILKAKGNTLWLIA